MKTYDHARGCNGGHIFRDAEGNRAEYSDRSDGTRQAFGHLIWADGTKGTYQELPENLFPERYNVTEAHAFAHRVKALGFVVYLAAQGHYGFITDDKGERVLSFAFGGCDDSLSGNYGPASKESGTGWRMDETPQSLRTAEDVRKALYASPPSWCRRSGQGWTHMTTLAQHIDMYGKSSHYREIMPAAIKAGEETHFRLTLSEHTAARGSYVDPDRYREGHRDYMPEMACRTGSGHAHKRSTREWNKVTCPQCLAARK